MINRRITSALAAVAVAGTGLAVAAAPGQAAAPAPQLGTRSLVQYLAADGHHFDHNRHDFDIADKFVHKVLAARPGSPLAVLTDGTKHVTAFLPTDGAFRRAATDIVGKRFESERRVYHALLRAGGIGGVENVMLYWLVPDQTLRYHALKTAAPTRLTSLQGGTMLVRLRDGRIVIRDHDTASPLSRIVWMKRNLNASNRQIAHGVSSMLSPVVN